MLVNTTIYGFREVNDAAVTVQVRADAVVWMFPAKSTTPLTEHASVLPETSVAVTMGLKYMYLSAYETAVGTFTTAAVEKT